MQVRGDHERRLCLLPQSRKGRYRATEPGSHHPLYRHDFAQIWYILEGTFTIGGKTYRPGTKISHADPHYEEELRTETDGVVLFVQYQGPSTGGRPVYDRRFNVAARKPFALQATVVSGFGE